MQRTITYLRAHAALLLFVLAGIGLSLILGVVLWPREPELSRHERVEQQEPGYRPGGPDCSPARLPTIPASRGDRDKRQSCAEMAEEHRLKEDDLRQQNRSAEAAEAVMWLTYNQSRTLIVGTVVGGLTLLAAIAAAIFAGDAARETRRAAIAAEEDGRPWLHVDELKVSRVSMSPDGRFFVTLSYYICNSGRWPALRTVPMAKAFLQWGAGAAAEFEAEMIALDGGHLAVPPGQRIEWEENAVGLVGDPPDMLNVTVVLAYSDPRGASHVTTQSYMIFRRDQAGNDVALRRDHMNDDLQVGTIRPMGRYHMT